MLPYKRLITIDRKSSISIYIQISNAFIALITKGILHPNAKLPSSRELSEILGINRNTVKTAYDELISQGCAESIDRKGVFVPNNIPKIKVEVLNSEKDDDNTTSFKWYKSGVRIKETPNFQKLELRIDDGFPDVSLAPIDALMREYRSNAKRNYSDEFLRYGSSQGSLNLRNSLSKFIKNTRGFQVSAENMIITRGSQMGIYLATRLLLKAGDTIAVGASNYFTADETFRCVNANLLRIPIDEKGLDIDFLENKLESRKIKAVYIIPHHHWPTTVTLPMNRRLKLLNLAKKYGFAIIEDDYDYDFHYTSNPCLPIASIDYNNHVVYLGSLCKTFAPGIRVGFMTGPSSFIAEATAIRSLIDCQGDTLLEEAFASLYENGEMDRHLRRSLKIYNRRRLLLCELLKSELTDKVDFKIPDGGLAVWTNFSEDINLNKTVEKARNKELHLISPRIYKTPDFNPNALRLGFASLPEGEMIKAVSILRDSIG